jgi:hypothetical protein
MRTGVVLKLEGQALACPYFLPFDTMPVRSSEALPMRGWQEHIFVVQRYIPLGEPIKLSFASIGCSRRSMLMFELVKVGTVFAINFMLY